MAKQKKLLEPIGSKDFDDLFDKLVTLPLKEKMKAEKKKKLLDKDRTYKLLKPM